MDDTLSRVLGRLENTKVEHNFESDRITGGVPVFTEEDVFKSRNMLSQIMRAIFIKEKINIQDLGSKQRTYLISSEIDPSKFSTAKTNLLAALARPAVSFNKFYETIVNILGYTMDISITLSKDGVEKKYVYSKLIPEIAGSKRTQLLCAPGILDKKDLDE